MAEILGLGCTHWPTLCLPNERLTDVFKRVLDAPNVDPAVKDPANWPSELLAELGNDDGLGAAQRCGERFGNDFRAIRKILDDFNPDFVLVWGDDQYENFKEDIIPPFCIFAYESLTTKPWEYNRGTNFWREPTDKTFTYKGNPAAGKFIATGMLEAGFDVSYAYKPLHHQLGHAFLNTLLFLDYDRKGFPYPVVPFQVNCYGRRVVAQQAGSRGLSEFPSGDQLDPPSPMPWRCFDLGAACARVVERSPWRVALIASSSWSHAFLTPKHYLLYPDVEADRALYEALQAADYKTWRERPLNAIEDSGQQEVLNWMCLIGAMNELGRRPTETSYVQSYIFNSNKCFAVFEP
jgi:Catalytic LigB subunit of aromatic ring-opening dioxygenase